MIWGNIKFAPEAENNSSVTPPPVENKGAVTPPPEQVSRDTETAEQKTAREATEKTAREAVEKQTKDFTDLRAKLPEPTYGEKDWKLPENVKVDESVLAEVTKTFKSLKLTKEEGQQLIDMNQRVEKNRFDAENKAFADLKAGWETELKSKFADKHDESLSLALNAVKALGGDELVKELEGFGLQKNPRLVFAFYKVATQMKDADFFVGTKDGTATKPASWYDHPTSNPEKKG